MNPDNSNPNGGTRDLQDPSNSDGQPNEPTASSTSPAEARTQQAAAANVLRTQIDGLFGNTTEVASTEITQAAEPSNEVANPYQRSHAEHPLPEAEQWKQYHTAWQNYYQKYYENYYTAAAAQTSSAIVTTNQDKNGTSNDGYFPEKADEQATTGEPEILSNDQALFELRQKLLGKVQESAHKIRRSRHFIPIASALGVVLVFVFIQYNQVFIANVKAYVSPGSIDPQNIVVDPNTDVVVSQDPRLIIPKINVDVPVTYDVGTDNASQMAAMANGLAHFPVAGASSHPGEVGNTVLAGHSSNDLFDGGNYKFIFAQLDKLTAGDTIYANYKGVRYTYVVTKVATVKPTDVNALVYPTTKPVMTLITCTPLGTALNRLLVTAEQVSPDPSAATAAPAGSGDASSTSAIPGDSGTVFSRLFGGGS